MMPPNSRTPTELARQLAAGERRALAEALSRLEQQVPDAGELSEALMPYLGRALVAGITGPPGAGKSTLVNALVHAVRATGSRVGVLAVDPSSPVSGGAILGDRIRITAAHDDDGVLVRSLGSRGALGGLTPAAVRMIDALDAAGFDLVLLETVGTGQSEIDVAEIADVAVVVSAPGLGDGIQAMKAGLLEIADVLVVNKIDRPGAERTVEELRAALALAAGGKRPALVRTAAIGEIGIGELHAEIMSRGRARLAQGLAVRRRRRARYLIAAAAAELIARHIKASEETTSTLADAVLAGRLGAGEAARRLLGLG